MWDLRRAVLGQLTPGVIRANGVRGGAPRSIHNTKLASESLKALGCYFSTRSSCLKGTFLSESTDVFVITPNRQTFFFPETKNLNFGDF